jgi:hypothetical protein
MQLLVMQFYQTSSLFSPNILLSTLFSNILSLGSSRCVRDQVSHPYRTTGKIRVLYILIFMCLDSKRPVMAAEWSKACTVFARSEAGIVCSNPTQGMDVWCLCVCLCAFFSVCVQVEALRRADHPPKESYRLSEI